MGAERFVEARRAFQRRDRRAQRVERPAVSGKRRVSRIRRRRQRFRMLGARQLCGKLVVFAFLRIDRVDLAEREASFVQTRSRSLTRRADTVELRRRILHLGERLLIRAERGGDICPRPSSMRRCSVGFIKR